MGLYKAMQASPKLESEGVWLDLEHTKILLARAGGGNMQYNTAMETIARTHKRVLDLGLMSSKRGMEIIHRAYAETIVKEWESLDEKTGDYVPGISQADDSIAPMTVENIIKAFVDVPEIFVMCKQTAENLQYYRQALVDDAIKN